MGKRLHVVKKREEYGELECFNWKYDEFAQLLGSLGCYVSFLSEDCSDRFDVPKDEFIKAMETLNEYKEGRIEDDEVYCDDIKEHLVALGYDENVDGLMTLMETFLRESDGDSEWLTFVAW